MNKRSRRIISTQSHCPNWSIDYKIGFSSSLSTVSNFIGHHRIINHLYFLFHFPHRFHALKFIISIFFIINFEWVREEEKNYLALNHRSKFSHLCRFLCKSFGFDWLWGERKENRTSNTERGLTIWMWATSNCVTFQVAVYNNKRPKQMKFLWNLSRWSWTLLSMSIKSVRGGWIEKLTYIHTFHHDTTYHYSNGLKWVITLSMHIRCGMLIMRIARFWSHFDLCRLKLTADKITNLIEIN